MENLREKPRVAAAAWIGLAVAMLIVLLPAGYTLLMSFQNYRVTDGLSSPWIGFANYGRFFTAAHSDSIIGNSMLLSVLGFVGALVLGMAAGWLVPRISGRIQRQIALGALLVPVFLPAACWAACLPAMADGDATASRWLFLLVSAISGAGIIGFSGAAYAMANLGRGFLKGVGWAALLWAFLILTPNYELLFIMQTPANASATLSLDAYVFTTGMQQMNMGIAASAFVVKVALAAAIGAVVCLGTYFVFYRGRRQPLDTFMREQAKAPFAVWAMPALLLCAAGCLFFGTRLSLGGAELPLMESLPAQLLMTGLAGLLAFLLAWAMIAALRAVPGAAYCALAGLFLAALNPQMGAFSLMRQAGLLNTVIPVILFALFTPTGMLLTLLCAKLSFAGRFYQSPKWLLAALPACYAMANVWGGFQTPMLHLANANLHPWGLTLLGGVLDGGAVGTATYLCVLVPVLLLCALGGFAVARYMQKDDPSIS